MKEIQWYMDMGCRIYVETKGLFIGLWGVTAGEICDGCGYKGTGECKAYPRATLNEQEPRKKKEKSAGLGEKRFAKVVEKKPPTLTNAEIAKKLGISKRQAAKLRREK